jgi:hypothetical protein
MAGTLKNHHEIYKWAGIIFFKVVVRPTVVIKPTLAHISCIAAITGKVISAVHKVVKPNFAPAWEYVAIPGGSSSLAPVINSGPKILKNFLIFEVKVGDVFI